MKFHLFHFLGVAASLMLCAACTESLDPGDSLYEPQPLVFSAEHLGGGNGLIPDTRAAADGAWDGDGTEYVAIQVDSEVKKYKVTSSSGTLEPYDSDNTFYRTDKSNIEITAWYPYSASQPSAPDIQTDQSTKAKREAGNLMTASATAEFGKTTTLTFSHQTALIRVSVTGEDGSAVTNATVKILGITAYNEGSGYYSALVKPQAITTSTNLIQVTTSVGTYKASAPADITLEKGKSYGYNFNLKRSLVTTNGIDVSLSETELEYTGSVLKPTVTVKYGSTTLTQDTDYTLSWSNSTSTAIGSYTVTVTGKGAYTGSVKKTYSIVEVPPYVTFTASGAQTFTMTLPTDAEAAAAIGTFEYSVGGGTWTAVTSGKDVSFGGDKGNLRLRGTGLNSAGSESLLGTAYHGGQYSSIQFGTSASVVATGDIRTLISYKNYSAVSTEKAKFCYLFKNCTALTSAPDLLATDLAKQCYQGLFMGCTSLGTAPALPATNLADNCYNAMFSGCEDLKTAPALKATNLTESCYFQMFSGCKKLEAAPDLPATVLTRQCYFQMFSGCTNLTEAPALNAETLAESCYYSMFEGCTQLKTGPISLPAKKLEESCYISMFSGCTSLKTAPTISAESLASQCCQLMFSGCTSLETAPALPATTLDEYCYQQMFSGCTNLTSAPELPATKLARQCYYLMFQGCTALKTAPELPATKLENSCYYGMFSGCTALETGPELPATTLAAYCYQKMFDGCTALKSVTIKATDILDSYYGTIENWLPAFASEASNPTRIIYKSKDLAQSKLNSIPGGIPSGWKCVDIVDYFYVEAVKAGVTVSMKKYANQYAPSVSLCYSTDGRNWKNFEVGTTTVTLSAAGDKVYFRAGTANDSSIKNTQLGESNGSYNGFSFINQVNVGGDITTLLSAEGGVADLSGYGTYTFYDLFENCSGIKSAEDLQLPSTTLVADCYTAMFNGCSKLETAPKLPATNLAADCYHGMFYYCSSLTEAPELPAETLVSNCYNYMFRYCAGLKSITIKAKTYLNWALDGWLINASKSGMIYYTSDAFYESMTKNSTSGIPSGWTASKL